MRLCFWSFCALLLAITGCAFAGTTDRIGYDDLKPDTAGMPGELALRKEVMMATNLALTATIHVTAKGNGFLEIGNLRLKVFDEHNDGTYYEPGLLNIEFADIDGDGRKELIISGIVCVTDEQTETVLGRNAVVYIYKLQSKNSFVQIYTNTKLRLE